MDPLQHPSVQRHFALWLAFVLACDARETDKDAVKKRNQMTTGLRDSYKELEHLNLAGWFHTLVFQWHLAEQAKLDMHSDKVLPPGY
jgi:hypothetical protein